MLLLQDYRSNCNTLKVLKTLMLETSFKFLSIKIPIYNGLKRSLKTLKLSRKSI